jgi:hypothetical protein
VAEFQARKCQGSGIDTKSDKADERKDAKYVVGGCHDVEGDRMMTLSPVCDLKYGRLCIK